MNPAHYSKAIVSVLGGLVTVLAPFVPGVEHILSPAIVQMIAAALTSFLVYQVPNR